MNEAPSNNEASSGTSALDDGLWHAHKHSAGVWSVARGAVVGVDFEYAQGVGVLDYQRARRAAKKLNASHSAGHNVEFRPLDAALSRPVAPGTQG